MPDEAESVMGADKVGYKNSSCNSLYYNPAITYSPPRKADGSFFNPIPSFTNAPYTGFLSYYTVPTAAQLAGSAVLAAWWGKQTSSVDLSAKFMPYDFVTLLTGVVTYPDPEPAYYYKYTGTATLKYDSLPCTDVDTGATRPASGPGGGNWEKQVVSATSGPGVDPDERQNFANWYSYYRIRISMIKSAASLAFAPLTNNVRVGFITVEPKLRPGDPGIDLGRYVPIADFDLAQRTTWFAKLFAQVPGGASPAREGLARVGRHYAGKTDGINTNMNGDPMQYACQQNFTLMTTDGYWNAQTESAGGGAGRRRREHPRAAGRRYSVSGDRCLLPAPHLRWRLERDRDGNQQGQRLRGLALRKSGDAEIDCPDHARADADVEDLGDHAAADDPVPAQPDSAFCADDEDDQDGHGAHQARHPVRARDRRAAQANHPGDEGHVSDCPGHQAISEHDRPDQGQHDTDLDDQDALHRARRGVVDDEVRSRS